MKAAGLPDQRDESEAERDDRNLAELLQELRVAGLGVQVLFGFLITGFVAGGLPAALITVFVVLAFGLLWFAFPLARRR